MIVSIALGLAWSALDLPLPGPLGEVLTLLGAAATPGALFAIGASLAALSAERFAVPLWLSVCKLALHPAAVAWFALAVFDVEPFAASVMIAAALVAGGGQRLHPGGALRGGAGAGVGIDPDLHRGERRDGHGRHRAPVPGRRMRRRPGRRKEDPR